MIFAFGFLFSVAAMGGEKSQEERRAAAEAYEYDKDSRWADYWSNVLLPQQMSTRPDVQKHFQLKYYQRYIVCPPALKSSTVNFKVITLNSSVSCIHQCRAVNLIVEIYP